MTPEEIRNHYLNGNSGRTGDDLDIAIDANIMLREIAAQLAEANELTRIGKGEPGPRKIIEADSHERTTLYKLAEMIRSRAGAPFEVHALIEVLDQFEKDHNDDIPF